MAQFGQIGSAFTPANALYDAASVDRNVQGFQRNALAMDNARQDQTQQTYAKDTEARIGLARQFAEAPDDMLAAEWGPSVQRLQAAGFGHGIDPSKPPPRERLRQIAASDLTTFQRLQLDEKRRQTEAWSGVMGGGAPAPAGGGGAPAALGAGGQQAAATAPAELMPHFEEASRATGIPVALLVAQAKQESGFRPDAVGRSGEGGIMQIMPSTARDPGFGMQGVDPATLRDPRANIMFGAQYLAARNPGANWNDPAQRDAGLGRYNGGGDPNYASNVTRNLPAAGPAGLPPGAAPQATPPGGVAGRIPGAVDTAGPGAPPAAALPPLDQNGLTAQQAAMVRAMGPERGYPEMARLAQQNRMERERAADDARRGTERQQDLAFRTAAEVRAEAARTQAAEADRRRQEIQEREAGKLPPALIEMRQETEDKLAGLTSARGALDEAAKLSAQAYAGPGATARGRAASVTGYDSASGTATTQFNSIMTEQALSQLRSIFGGNPTEGERKILVDMQASPSMSRAERDALIERARVAVRTREGAAQSRLTEIRQGTYGRTDPNYRPPAAAPPPGGGGGNTPAPMSGADALAAARSKLGAGASDDDLVAEARRLRGGG